MPNYRPTIGLEVHVQLNTKTKLFSTAATSFGDQPNSHTTELCLALPGALPVLNQQAVKKAVQAGLALQGQIQKRSKFDRKNYFYPDLPKGYQISQLYEPFCLAGQVTIEKEDGSQKTIGITRIHMEEDAGKLIHSEDPGVDASFVDLNRAGTPLIEIVSDPVIDSPDEAVAYLTNLKAILLYIGVSDCSMEQGSLRVDANVSIRPEGQEELGTRVEIKNLNSFKAVKAAIEYEMERHEELLDSGQKITQETRLWNANYLQTFSMRSKEEAHDYRYFPDPDLVPLILEEEQIKSWATELPELPKVKKDRFIAEYGLPAYDADVLTVNKVTADYFEKVVQEGASAKKASNWIMAECMAVMTEKACEITELFPAEHLSQLIQSIESGAISGKMGKSVFSEMLNSGKDPKTIISEQGLAQISDPAQVESLIDQVLQENPDSVADFKAGKDRAQKHLMGQVMKLSKGKANPGLVNQVVLKKLNEQ